MTPEDVLRFQCVDCFADTMKNDYYMVRDDLWSKYGSGETMLCIECLSKRIGRPLRASDLTPILMNDSILRRLNP